MKSHGKEILRDLHARSLKGKLRSWGQKMGWFLVKWSAVGVFVFAGWCGADVITQIM